jgi:hypothetical protein
MPNKSLILAMEISIKFDKISSISAPKKLSRRIAPGCRAAPAGPGRYFADLAGPKNSKRLALTLGGWPDLKIRRLLCRSTRT